MQASPIFLTPQQSDELSPYAIQLSNEHFGAVATAGFGWWRESEGTTSYIHQNYPEPSRGEFQIGSRLDHAIDTLGVAALRYPGGTEAWQSFKWRQSEQTPDHTGLTEIEKLHKVIEYCGLKGLSLSFTLPVRTLEQHPEALRSELETFLIEELLAKAQAEGVVISSIKLGNEYNVSSEAFPRWPAELYGDVASALTLIVGQSLDQFATAQEKQSTWIRPEILVESGVIWKYGAADISSDLEGDGVFTRNGVQDTYDIFSAFDSDELAYLDGIDLHNLTLNQTYEDFFGLEPEESRLDWLPLSELYNEMIMRWSNYLETRSEGISYHSLAWSLPRSNVEGGAGLINAGLVPLQLHEMSRNGISSAWSWLAAGFSANSLVSPAVLGTSPANSMLTPSGEVFASMSESLIGFTAIPMITDYNYDSPILTRTFASDDDLALFAINRTASIASLAVDMEYILDDLFGQGAFFRIEVTVFDADPDIPNSAIITDLHPSSPDKIIELTLQESEVALLNVSPVVKANSLNTGFGPRGEILGTQQPDTLVGTDGRDVIDGAQSADAMFGGQGNDYYLVDHPRDMVVEELGFSAGGGIDTILSEISYSLPRNVEILRLGSPDSFAPLSGSGNHAPEALVGNAGANMLSGGGGNDQLKGLAGDDLLIGGTGRDTLVGGQGADTFVFSGVVDSPSGQMNRDVINGFETGVDKIDLAELVVSNRAGSVVHFLEFEAFELNTQNASSSIRLQSVGLDTAVLLEVDIDGNAIHDFQVLVLGPDRLDEGDIIF